MPKRSEADANFPTGTDGRVVVDKTDNRLLFLDPVTYVTLQVLDGFATRIHELAISPDHGRALCRSTATDATAPIRILGTSWPCST